MKYLLRRRSERLVDPCAQVNGYLYSKLQWSSAEHRRERYVVLYLCHRNASN